MKRNIIFYKTTADFDNTGEVLIYKSLLYLLRTQGTIVIDDSPSISQLFLQRITVNQEERLSNKSKRSFILFLIITSLRTIFTKNRVFLITGVGEHFINGNRAIFKNILSAFFCISLRVLGVKLVRIGMSMKFAGKKEALSEKFLSFSLNHYYVRDSLSYVFCKKSGINKVKIAPDLSWGYHVNYKKEQNEGKNVVLNFRAFCESEENQEEYVATIKATIDHIVFTLNKGRAFEKIYITHQVNKDSIFSEIIYEELKAKNFNVKLIDELITLENASKYYGNSRFVFSNRLHVLLLAYKYQALPVAVTDLTKHVKITGIFKDSFLDALLMDVNKSKKAISKQIQDIDENLDSYLKKIKEVEKNNSLELKCITHSIFQ